MSMARDFAIILLCAAALFWVASAENTGILVAKAVKAYNMEMAK